MMRAPIVCELCVGKKQRNKQRPNKLLIDFTRMGKGGGGGGGGVRPQLLLRFQLTILVKYSKDSWSKKLCCVFFSFGPPYYKVGQSKGILAYSLKLTV